MNLNKALILDVVYPVGSIYMSVNSTSPATLFGGTWVQIKDTFLLACGDTYSNGSTGGEATHTLIESEIPTHHHNTGISGYVNADSGLPSAQSGAGYRPIAMKHSMDISASDIYTSEYGTSQAHNNMPPYLAVYMWKRTA